MKYILMKYFDYMFLLESFAENASLDAPINFHTTVLIFKWTITYCVCILNVVSFYLYLIV